MEKEKVMDELIRRQDVIDIIEDFGFIDGYTDTLELTKDILQLPLVQHDIVDIAKVTMAMAKKADLVAVVRCKDCNHWLEDDPTQLCPWDFRNMDWPDENDYCSKGELKDG